MTYIHKEPSKIGIKGYKKNNCTMTAIGNALGISYDLAKKILQTYMWTSITRDKIFFREKDPLFKSEFTKQRHVHNVCSALAVETVEFREDITLSEFVKKNERGIYLVLVERHLTVVKDGEIIDTWDSSRRRVISSYKINIDCARTLINPIAEFYEIDGEDHISKEISHLEAA